MTSPLSPLAPQPTPLDTLEARARDALDIPLGAGWAPVLAELSEAEKSGTLYADPPPIDPSEPRLSSNELRALITSMTSVTSMSARAKTGPTELPQRTRAGYAIEGAAEQRAVVKPAFASTLAFAFNRRDTFRDLWSLDVSLWDQLDEANPRELAILWLESPGRRLVQQIEILTEMPRTERLGATDLSLDRIYDAAGVRTIPAEINDLAAWFAAMPRHRADFRELHAAVPGKSMEAWEPRDPGNAVPRALRLLEQGSPLGLRGAALMWLFNLAVREPFYEVDGVRHDLRDDLPIRLATALPAWRGDDRTSTVTGELETLTLQHAARITAADHGPSAPLRAWGVARWLHRCLLRSPYFGGDEETIAAHLRARLPRSQQLSLDAVDALDPRRFVAVSGGLDAADTALIAGVLGHYHQGWSEPSRSFIPTPLPLVHALKSIAARKVRAAEESAEAALAEGRNALGWPSDGDGAPLPVAPPLAAQRVMTELRVGWMKDAGEPAQLEALQLFEREPRRFDWIARAIYREGSALSRAATDKAVAVFRTLMAEPDRDRRVDGHLLCTMAAGLLANLTDEDVQRAAREAHTGAIEFRPFVLDALAGAAEPLERASAWSCALDLLLAVMGDTELPPLVRQNAALFALRRASASRLQGRASVLARLVEAAASPPFNEHQGLRRELKRLGLSPKAGSHGERR